MGDEIRIHAASIQVGAADRARHTQPLGPIDVLRVDRYALHAGEASDECVVHGGAVELCATDGRLTSACPVDEVRAGERRQDEQDGRGKETRCRDCDSSPLSTSAPRLYLPEHAISLPVAVCANQSRSARERQARSASANATSTSRSAAAIEMPSPWTTPSPTASTPAASARKNSSFGSPAASTIPPGPSPKRLVSPEPPRSSTSGSRSTSMPTRAAIAISASAQARPPSLTSCAALTRPSRTSSRTSPSAAST